MYDINYDLYNILLNAASYQQQMAVFKSKMIGLRFSSLEANSSFLIIFAGLDEISSVAFRFTQFLISYLSKERSLAGWLWSSVPDKILVESASVLILALHFCLFKEQRQDISPDFSILSLRNVYTSTIKHSFPIIVWVFTICKSILYEDK
jgi:hypothetical protein